MLTLVAAVHAVLALTLGTGNDPIRPNDNRAAAGHLRRGVLTVTLEARTGVWAPEGAAGPQIVTAAFAEAGRPMQTPGPVLRVPAGTEIRATVRNRLKAPLWMYGMGRERGFASDSFSIAPGASREIRFRVAEAGTYYYAARSSAPALDARRGDDSQLNGLIIVDPPGTRPKDRIFVVTNWFTLDTTTVSGLGPNATLAFNGLSWPFTERIEAAMRDSLTWRIVNLSVLEHPLHLHGTYFRVDARGDGVRDTVYTADQQRLAVTEMVLPGQTMLIRWTPLHPGNWIFHCHLAGHIAAREAFESDRRMPAAPVAGEHQHDPLHHNMAALVIGVHVKDDGSPGLSYEGARPIRLIVRSRAAVYGDYVGYSYVLGGSAEEADSTAMPIPGPTLTLTRGKPVAVTIVNRSHDPAAIHWHGIELESYPDGVPGWSGRGPTLPMIAPGDSLTVRFTPPRAGTFMYHSHSNEFQQIASGLYGALLVVDSETPRDTSTDRVLLFSDGGPTLNFLAPPPPTYLNGSATPAPLQLVGGKTTRLRLINIRTDYTLKVGLLDGEHPVTWRPIAKDGADLPAVQAREQPAEMVLSPGETVDLEVTPPAGANLTLAYDMVGFEKQLKTVAVTGQ